MRYSNLGFGLLVSLASASAFAANDLDMKISCSYNVPEYEETYLLGIPIGDDENATTFVREPDIKVSARIYIASYKKSEEPLAEGEEPVNENQVDVTIIRVVKDAEGESHSKVAARGTFSLDGQNTEFVIREQGEGFNNLVSCRYLTKEEIEKKAKEKEDARIAEEERKKQEAKEEAEAEQERIEREKRIADEEKQAEEQPSEPAPQQ